MSGTTVKEIMTHLVATLKPEDTLHEAAARLARNHISGAPVVRWDQVVGVITEADIIRAMTRSGEVDGGRTALDLLSIVTRDRGRGVHEDRSPTVGDVMTPNVVFVSPEDTMWKAAEVMQRRSVKRLPVVDAEGALVGILSRGDLVRFMGRDDRTIRDDVLKAIRILGVEVIPDLSVESDAGGVTLSGTADRSSTRRLAVAIAARVPGVVRVEDGLEFEWDDREPAGAVTRVSPWDEVHKI